MRINIARRCQGLDTSDKCKHTNDLVLFSYTKLLKLSSLFNLEAPRLHGFIRRHPSNLLSSTTTPTISHRKLSNFALYTLRGRIALR